MSRSYLFEWDSDKSMSACLNEVRPGCGARIRTTRLTLTRSTHHLPLFFIQTSLCPAHPCHQESAVTLLVDFLMEKNPDNHFI